MEKTIISLLKGGSAVVYILIFCLIFSMPVIFIYQAFMPPVFTLDSVAVEESFTGDEVINEASEEWQKLQLSLTANAGKFSPYTYEINEFTAEGIESEHRIMLDEPVFCTKDISDPFTITLYIKGETDINELLKSVSFTASDYGKSFGEFTLKFIDGKAQFFKK